MSLLTVRSSAGGANEGRGGCAVVLAAARAAAADVALITDAGQTITYVSASFTAMTGYEPEDLLGHDCRVLQGPGTDTDTKNQMRDVLASGEVFEGRILNYRKGGSAFWTALKIIPMRVGDGPEVTHFVSVQRDISNKVALLKQLQTQALHDHVTGLPNRAAAEEAVAEAVGRAPDGKAATVVGLIDLDDFRVVNNTLGHAAGDAVLQQWATRVLSRLRDGDLLARMGGDEFLLILRNITRMTSEEDIPEILDHLHEAVEEPFAVNGQRIRIGMSMGIALVPEDGTDSRTILRSADEALYTAKKRQDQTMPWWETAAHDGLHPVQTGRSTGGATGDGGTGARLHTEDYRGALRSGDVLVHFQPVVDLRDGSVHLFEALARLRLPGGVIAHPDQFLPRLDTEDQRALFAAVLDQALAGVAGWDQDGVHFDVSVNLPPEILHDGTIPAIVEASLRRHGIAPHRLGLELLESQAMGIETQRRVLQELVALGVGLAMDDLGSGYSSLQRLSSFPFSAIKLDRGLLLHAYDKPLETLSIMATLIQMGRDLGMNVVIEGLEEESLTEAAIILGAPLGQGYHLAAPMAVAECAAWFGTFELRLHRSPIQTFLGALAYHWQFARLASPHPLDLQQCPLTRFIRGGEVTTEVESWHALQHTSQGIHPAASRLLIGWLTHQVRPPSSRDSC